MFRFLDAKPVVLALLLKGPRMPQLSIKRRSEEILVTICDQELFGRELREGDLSLEVSPSFYEGEEVSVEECLEALKEATIANMVGSIVEEAIEAGYVDSDYVLEIEGVQHAQMVRP